MWHLQSAIGGPKNSVEKGCLKYVFWGELLDDILVQIFDISPPIYLWLWLVQIQAIAISNPAHMALAGVSE